MIVVEFQHEAGRRRAWVTGAGDIYDLGAFVSVLGAEQLVAAVSTKTGVLSPAEAFANAGLLEQICRSEYIDGGLRIEDLTSQTQSAG